MSEPCDCLSWCMTNPAEQLGLHHNKACPKYKTEKFPLLFYFEEAENCWTIAPDELSGIISTDNLEDGDDAEIQFKRIDMTDEQVDALPEV